MKVTIKGFVHTYPSTSCLAGEFVVFGSDMTQYGNQILVGECEFEYEVPASFNPVAVEIDGLEKKLTEISDQFMRQSRELKSRIADLKCLPAPTESVA